MSQARKIKAILVVLFFLFGLSAELSASVWTVGRDCDFQEIQEAINVASDGDLVLVSSGTYKSIIIRALSLTVAADTQADVSILGGIDIESLPAHRTVVLAGIKAERDPDDEQETVALKSNQGSLRFENCTLNGSDSDYWWGNDRGEIAVTIKGCDDVAFIGCTISGGAGGDYNNGEEAINVVGSMVAIYDSMLIGGEGGSAWSYGASGGDGGAGCQMSTGHLFASGSTFQGGDGGHGASANEWAGAGNGGDGGHGIWTTSSLAETWLRDNDCQGGKKGHGGGGWIWFPPGSDGKPGFPILLDGSMLKIYPAHAQEYSLPAPVREHQKIQIAFNGTPGGTAFLLFAANPGTMLITGMMGQYLLPIDPAPMFFIAGQLDSVTGELIVHTRVPKLPPGIDTLNIYTQTIVIEPSGTALLGTARTLVVMDDGF